MRLPRTCRYCGKQEQPSNAADWYDPDTSSGRSAGQCCKQCWVDKAVEWRNNNRARANDRLHKQQAMKNHGLTSDEYDELYSNATCGGCGATVSNYKGRTARLAIDHNHETGRVRGLLCHDCNRTIATALDNPATLRALAHYLEHNKETAGAVAEG